MPRHMKKPDVDPRKVYLTRYVMDRGIEEVEALPFQPHDKDIEVLDASHAARTGYWYTFKVYGRGKDWHLTRDDALSRAEQVRTQKVRTLQAQLERLLDKEF